MERTFSIRKFRSGILVHYTFQEIRFPEKVSVQGDKIDLSISIPSEISGFFFFFWGGGGVNGKQPMVIVLRVFLVKNC